MRGLGLQSKAVYGNFMNYLLGFPLVYVLGFVCDLKLIGLWSAVYIT